MDKIICVGKNYLEHAKELGDAVPEKPVLFLKPPSICVHVSDAKENALKATDRTITVDFPKHRGSVHYECEIVLRLKEVIEPLTEANALGFITGVTLGLDLTLRAEQKILKKNGHPWEMAKVFAGSAIVGDWIEGAEISAFLKKDFRFLIDGELRQHGRPEQMLYSVAKCIAYAQEYFPIQAGDFLFTGTPAGVGPCLPGQTGVMQWGDRVLASVRW